MCMCVSGECVKMYVYDRCVCKQFMSRGVSVCKCVSVREK